MQRHPIRMTTMVGGDGDEMLIVLCDDSTIWAYEQDDGKPPAWKQLPDIPPSLDPQQQRELTVER